MFHPAGFPLPLTLLSGLLQYLPPHPSGTQQQASGWAELWYVSVWVLWMLLSLVTALLTLLVPFNLYLCFIWRIKNKLINLCKACKTSGIVCIVEMKLQPPGGTTGQIMMEPKYRCLGPWWTSCVSELCFRPVTFKIWRKLIPIWWTMNCTCLLSCEEVVMDGGAPQQTLFLSAFYFHFPQSSPSGSIVIPDITR